MYECVLINMCICATDDDVCAVLHGARNTTQNRYSLGLVGAVLASLFAPFVIIRPARIRDLALALALVRMQNVQVNSFYLPQYMCV